MSAPHDLRLADLVTLIAVGRTGSISGAAREVRVTPSQVSKAIVRLERHFDVRLLSRGARGVSPTAAGRLILPRVANAVAQLSTLACRCPSLAPSPEVTIAGPSYLLSSILQAIAAGLPAARFRVLELAPAQLRACLHENVFDVAIVPGGVGKFPAAWTDEVVGSCRSGLFARPSFAKRLGPLPLTIGRVAALPFVGPAKTAGERFSAVGDDCPLLWEKRWIAHESQTIGLALELVSHTDHVVFGPLLAARHLLGSGNLVELPVVSWDVREPLHLLCDGERVLSSVRRVFVRCARQAIEMEDPPVSVGSYAKLAAANGARLHP